MQLPPHITPPAPKRNVPERAPVYALVGNPNCGKSTLFNALTGLKQKVGNYPGVTVEKKVGTAYSQHGQPLTVIDLPGAYSLAARLAEIVNDRRDGTNEQLGEILGYVDMTRNAVELSVEKCRTWPDGGVFPDPRVLTSMRSLLAVWMPRVNEIIRTIGSHNQIGKAHV